MVVGQAIVEVVVFPPSELIVYSLTQGSEVGDVPSGTNPTPGYM
jgi:hypothetical protein